MECDTSDVVGMSFEGEYSRGVCGFDVVEFHGVMASCCKISLIRRNGKPVDLVVVSRRCKSWHEITIILPENRDAG